ncbi:DMT family transporter [Psychrobacter sp. B38]|uniref:DMT family transporter n=1 Tax=Psychrobacter sp. B38 TaxID=3143538 RepID=UPI00320E9073
MFKLIKNSKEALFFCLVSALSFVLMSEAVESIDPITSTFITFSISLLFFALLNFRKIGEIFNIFVARKKDFGVINFSTLVNTLSAFVVMQYVPPITYVIVFFSSIPLFTNLLSLKIDKVLIKQIAVVVISLGIAAMVSNSNTNALLLGISLTLLSSAFAAIYMKKTSELHKKTEIQTSQVLAARFILVAIVCGCYSIYKGTYTQVSTDNMLLFIYIALTSSIIPLFLLQSSIKKIGSSQTSNFMPLIPILCFVLMALSDSYTVTIKELVLVIILTIILLLSNVKGKIYRLKEKNID